MSNCTTGMGIGISRLDKDLGMLHVNNAELLTRRLTRGHAIIYCLGCQVSKKWTRVELPEIGRWI